MGDHSASTPSQARTRRSPRTNGNSNGNDTMDGIIERFDAIELSGKKPPSTPNRGSPAHTQQSRGNGFVGGFHPGFTPSPARSPDSSRTLPRPQHYTGYPNVAPPVPPQPPRAPGALPQPPRMPMPQPTPHRQFSRTMQYALRTNPPPRLHPDALAPPTPPHYARTDRPNSESAVPNAVSLGTYTPQPPKVTPPPTHRRAQSDPPSPVSSRPGTVQCSGMTQAGKRCTRQCKQTLGADEDVFCFQHMKKINGVRTMFDKKTNTQDIKFDDWISEHLQESTKAALRSEMTKPRSASDAPGYIYTFVILDRTTPDQVHLKVGRANNLNRRMDEWSKQCGSKEQVLRGFWPEPESPEEASLIAGRIMAGEKGPWCHRVERLVHIELADLAINRQYLDPKFPKVAAPDAEKEMPAQRNLKPCPDCNTTHKEIFTFDRVNDEGKEFELIVKPVIKKWGDFVRDFV